MNKYAWRIAFWFFLLPPAALLHAQSSFYSYINDRSFRTPDELLGYTFVPNEVVFPDKDRPDRSPKESLYAGDVVFSISPSYLYVTGEGIEGAYSIVSINTTDFGFILALLNARNPSVQGHLKIILNDVGEADALVFKKANNTPEAVYYLATLPEEVNESETAFFTDINEVIATDSTLWDMVLHPFFEMEGRQQNRLQLQDKVEIRLVEDSVLVKKKMQAVHRIEIDYVIKDETGNKTFQKQTFVVQKVVERQRVGSAIANDAYLLEFTVENLKSKTITFALNQNRAITSLRIGETLFWMRGYRE